MAIRIINLPLKKYGLHRFQRLIRVIFLRLSHYIPKIIVLLQRCSPERVYAPPLEDYLKSSSCILNLLESISSLSYVTSAPFRTRVTEVMFLLLLILSLIASLNLPIEISDSITITATGACLFASRRALSMELIVVD